MIRSSFGAAVLASFCVLTAVGCTGGNTGAPLPEGTHLKIKGVVLETVQSRDVAERQEAVGTVKAVTSAVIAARVAGTVTQLACQEGDRVRKGQLLGMIEASETAAGAAAAQAGVEEAKRALEEFQSRKKLADATFQRYSRLYAEQAVTRQEFEIRQSEQEVAATGVTRAEHRLTQARESARAAGIVADYSRVIAPIGGLVTAKAVDRGASVFPGMQLLTIEEESGFRLEVQAPETLLGRISVGQAVDVSIDGSSTIQNGRTAEIVPLVDPASRTFVVKVSLPGKGIRSGSYGRAFFPVGSTKGLLVPKAALIERGALTSLWVIDSRNNVRMRLVKPGRQIGDRVEVLSGLSEGERIAVGNMEKLTDGAEVE